jgi:hypothetical protein
MRFLFAREAKAWWRVLLLPFLGATLHGKEEGMPKLPAFEFHAPLPALVAAAARANVALDGVEASAARAGELQPGDRIAALVSLVDKDALTQWLVEATCVELETKERELPPLRTWTLFTNAGTELFIGGERAALTVRVLGPFVRGKKGNDNEQKARVLVNAVFLGLGLDRGCEAVISVNAAKVKDPTLESFAWGTRLKPYPEEEVARGRRLAEPLGITPARERALVGAAPALHEFFNIMSRTPGLEGILKKVIDVPWWAIIKKGGDASVAVAPQFRSAAEISPEPFRVGERKTYELPFQLTISGERALVGKLAVTDPRPPLSVSAGIVGVTAWSPDGKGPQVMLQVISARSGMRAKADAAGGG